MPTFHLHLGGKLLRIFELEQDIIIIGRHQHADIFIDNPAVSRKHARIYFNHGAYVLEDLGSVNGVYLNGRRIKAHFLSDGDEIQISKFSIGYKAGYLHPDRTNRTFMPDLPESEVDKLGERTVYVKPASKASPPARAAARPAPALQNRRRPYLKILGAGPDARHFLDKKVTVIGKGGDADVVLKGLFSANRVADIVLVDRSFWLKSHSLLQSVKVNGSRVKEARLKNDDLIQIGDNLFTFKEA